MNYKNNNSAARRYDDLKIRIKMIVASSLLPIGAIVMAASLLISCTSNNLGDGLRPATGLGNESAPQSSADQNASSQVALLPIDGGANDTLRPSPGVIFLPVVGPPQIAVTDLSSAIKSSAMANKITIIPAGQAGATYQVKGYFSALDDGSGTILVFIWDILDTSGKAVHRISGEERTGLRKSDPWSAVNSSMINNIVARTMQNFRNWMNTRS